MTSLRLLRISCAAIALAAATQVGAESLGTSASSAGSSASGSASTSLGASSNSAGKAVADGDYRITDVAAAPGRDGFVRVALASDAPQPQQLVLELPAAVFGPQQLGVGDTVRAQHRVYGIEFARGDTHEPFFLVLADAWHEELAPRPVNAL